MQESLPKVSSQGTSTSGGTRWQALWVYIQIKMPQLSKNAELLSRKGGGSFLHLLGINTWALPQWPEERKMLVRARKCHTKGLLATRTGREVPTSDPKVLTPRAALLRASSRGLMDVPSSLNFVNHWLSNFALKVSLHLLLKSAKPLGSGNVRFTRVGSKEFELSRTGQMAEFQRASSLHLF